VLSRSAYVIEHGEQLDEGAGNSRLAYGLPVTLDPAAVVGVFSLQALKVGGQLGQLGFDWSGGLVVLRRSPWPLALDRRPILV